MDVVAYLSRLSATQALSPELFAKLLEAWGGLRNRGQPEGVKRRVLRYLSPRWGLTAQQLGELLALAEEKEALLLVLRARVVNPEELDVNTLMSTGRRKVLGGRTREAGMRSRFFLLLFCFPSNSDAVFRGVCGVRSTGSSGS